MSTPEASRSWMLRANAHRDRSGPRNHALTGLGSNVLAFSTNPRLGHQPRVAARVGVCLMNERPRCSSRNALISTVDNRLNCTRRDWSLALVAGPRGRPFPHLDPWGPPSRKDMQEAAMQRWHCCIAGSLRKGLYPRVVLHPAVCQLSTLGTQPLWIGRWTFFQPPNPEVMRSLPGIALSFVYQPSQLSLCDARVCCWP